MDRKQLLSEIRSFYKTERLSKLDKDFIDFEEDMAEISDLNDILSLLSKQVKIDNPYNSCILYATGLSSQFDFKLARSFTKNGTPPDLDIDFNAFGKDKALELVAQRWGRDNVANIITHGTFKPKSLTNKFFKLTEPLDPVEIEQHNAVYSEIYSMIPEARFGKEATLQEIVEGSVAKQYDAHLELKTNPKYKEWYDFTSQLEDSVAQAGIHASGVVILDFPIYEIIPMWMNSKAERITQYDMKECEELGAIKFDFLVINNLDIIKTAVALIKQRHGIEYDIYNIPDEDPKTYKLLNSGYVQGVFQMETSRTAKELIIDIQPQSIHDLSDINALNRPGPLQYAKQYAENKRNNSAPEDLPAPIADIIKSTHYILLYQEQVMQLCVSVAGYTLREADDIRRALGKKKADVLAPYKQSFIEGLQKHGISYDYADEYWTKTLMPFADYS